MLFLRRITQLGLIIIDPPEKLVLEVDSAGAYSRFNWDRNGVSFSNNPTAPFPIPGRFFYFTDAYVREPTAEEDLGLYEVNLNQAGSQNTVGAPDQVFMVVSYGRPLTYNFRSAVCTCLPWLRYAIYVEDTYTYRSTTTLLDTV